MNYLQLRSKTRKYILDILSFFSKPNPGIHILNGHFLSLNNNASGDLFQELLNKLKRSNIKLIDIELAVELITKNMAPQNECFIAFTFDDGFKECYTKIRPVLNQNNIKAAFFINPGFIEGDEKYRLNFKRNVVETDKEPMSWNEIITLANENHIIGAHTIDHVNLNINNISLLEHQIGTCKTIIENKLGKSCDYFAYPFGKLENFSKTALEISKKHYPYIFSQSNYQKYFSFNNSVINRRHFECDWSYKHVLYFLKSKQ